MSVINNGILLGAGADAAVGYQVSRSIRLNSADSAHFSRTPGSAGNRKTWTWAGWVKRSGLGAVQEIFAGGDGGTDTTQFEIGFAGSDIFYCWGAVTEYLNTTQVFRDAGAWYHIVVAFDTTQATANNRLRLYVNGLEVTTFSTNNRASLTQNGDFGVNQAALHTIGRRASAASWYLNGYLADIHFIDGQALDPTSFTETDASTGQLIPKAFTGSYCTNGFRLTFSDNSGTTSTTLGKDAAGSNNFTPSGFSVASGAGNDSLVDSPTGYGTDTGAGNEVRGSYCTFNPLFAVTSLTLSNGNLETSSPGAAWKNAKGTFAMTSGKWYWEHTVPATGASDGYIGGVATATADYSSSSTGIWGRQGTTKYSNGSSSTPFSSTTSGDILGFAFDADTGKLWVAQNGTWVGDPAAGTSESWSSIPSGVFPYVAAYNQANVINFGQRAFAYTNGRSGFKALCSHNLPEPTILQGTTAKDVKLYTGNGSTQTISGLGFSPDLVWIKGRSIAADHGLFDIVRGTTKRLVSNATQAEDTQSGVTAFNSNGFDLGSYAGQNNNNDTYAAWCWDAGSSTDTNNTAGSITSSVRANATAGFSIVTYTGTGSAATVGHGLGVAPSMIIVKSRNTGSTNWGVYHVGVSSTPQNSALNLDNTGAIDTQSAYWNNTAPTSTVFSVGTWGGSNGSTRTYVAYCFAPVVGYSSALSWTGNGSNDGPMLHCGFAPRFFIAKRTDSSNDWWMWDTARSNTGNPVDEWLSPNRSDQEYGNDADFDFLSNGVKIRTSSSSVNASGGTYIGFAWAESPFNYARAR